MGSRIQFIHNLCIIKITFVPSRRDIYFLYMLFKLPKNRNTILQQPLNFYCVIITPNSIAFLSFVQIERVSEICKCVRERKGRYGGATLFKRRKITKNGSSLGTKVKDSARSENIGLQRSNLCRVSSIERLVF